MATSTRWGGFRPDPYNPNAFDADNDGIVQEGTLFERPAGTRFINLDGSEIAVMLRGDNLRDIQSLRLVDETGSSVDYVPSWRREGQLSLGQRLGTLDSMGGLTVGQLNGSSPLPTPPRSIAREPSPLESLTIPDDLGGPAGLSELQSLYPELFNDDGSLRRPKRPFTYRHGLVGGADDLMEGVESWDDVRERLKGKTIIAYDYETTDFVNRGGRAFQIGAVKIENGEVVDRFNMYMNPGIPWDNWSDFSQGLQGPDGSVLRPETVSAFVGSRDAHAEFVRWVGDGEFFTMAHNGLEFDDPLLEIELNAANIEGFSPDGKIDTLSLSRDLIDTKEDNPVAPDHKLGTLTEAFGIELGDKAHTADADSAATGELLFRLIDSAEERDLSLDFVRPGPSRERDNERQRDLAERMDRYNEIRGIHDRIQEATKERKRINQESIEIRADEDFVSVSEFEDDPEGQILSREEIGERISSVTSYTDTLLTGDGKVYEEDSSEYDVTFGEERAIVNVRLREDGTLAGASEEGAQAVAETKEIGRSVRLIAQARFEKDNEVKALRKRLSGLNAEKADLDKASIEATEKVLLRRDEKSQELFDLSYNDLDDDQAAAVVSALGSDLEFDNIASDAVAKREALEQHVRLFTKPTLYELRRKYAEKLSDVLAGRDSKGKRSEREALYDIDVELPDITEIADVTYADIDENLDMRVSLEEAERREQIARRALEDTWASLPDPIKRSLADSVGEANLSVIIEPAGDGALGYFHVVEGEYRIVLDPSIFEGVAGGGSVRDMVYQTTFHEMIHAFEESNPEIWKLSQPFAAERLKGQSVDDFQVNVTGQPEHPDDFVNSYSGTINDVETGFMETLSTSLERVLAPKVNDPVEQIDEDQLDFAIGALLVGGRRGVDVPSDQRRFDVVVSSQRADRIAPEGNDLITSTNERKSSITDRGGNPLNVSVPDSTQFHGVTREVNGFGNPEFTTAQNYFTQRNQTLRGTPISPDDPSIPETIFHVSPKAQAILSEGTLRARGSGGLGGDDRDRIVSFTTNREVAEQLSSDMKFFAQYAKLSGKPDSVEEIIEIIKEDADKYGFNISESTLNSFREYIRRGDPPNFYFVSRSIATDTPDPHFQSDAMSVWSMLDPEDVYIIEVPKENLNTGAMVTNFDVGTPGGLDEIRVYGDVNVEAE